VDDCYFGYITKLEKKFLVYTPAIVLDNLCHFFDIEIEKVVKKDVVI
jgi:hypothetical protein